MLTKFSKEYTDTIQANLIYQNIPDRITIVGDRTVMVRFNITTNGFESLFYKIKKPKIELNVSSYYKEGLKSISLSNDDLVHILNDQISNNNSVRSVSGDGLTIYLDSIISIKLPVIINSNIQFKEGFKGVGDFVIEPDSIIASGPREALSSMNHIISEKLNMGDVDNTIEKEIKLISPENENIKIDPSNVMAILKVEEFTQKQLILPVELINIPEGLTVKLLPENISITFDISIEDFNTITQSDFRLFCDFTSRDESNNTLTPIIDKYPEYISNLVLDSQRIEYLIFK
jgi:hypothetical protein